MPEKKYFMEDYIKWAACYKSCLSFAEVARKFDVPRCVVSRALQKHHKALAIVLWSDIEKILKQSGLKKCSGCGEIRAEYLFHGRGECAFCKSDKDKRYREENWESVYRKKREYIRNNRDDVRRWYRKYSKKRKENDIQFKIACNLRARLKSAVKNRSASKIIKENLGCSIEELICKLESQFYPNTETDEKMSWDNYGLYGWHLDHIKPLVMFDLTSSGDLKKACHYSNLQPLWAKDNLSKGAKYNEEETD